MGKEWPDSRQLLWETGLHLLSQCDRVPQERNTAAREDRRRYSPHRVNAQIPLPGFPAGESHQQPNEITDILAALETEPIKWRCIVHLMIVTGCRRGEIMGLKWEQIDLDARLIHICETLLASDSGIHADTPKTPESRRYINIPEETAALLRAYQKEQNHIRAVVGDRWQESGYVFTQETGLPMHPDSINGWLKKFSERHGLRHIKESKSASN
ncbi:MAG: site-specific integrase [Dysosmobacter sp.]